MLSLIPLSLQAQPATPVSAIPCHGRLAWTWTRGRPCWKGFAQQPCCRSKVQFRSSGESGAGRAFAKSLAENCLWNLPLVVVINLARRSDRWRKVNQRLQDLGLRFQRLEATDGKTEAIPEAIVGKWWTHGVVRWGGDIERLYHEGFDALVGDDFCMVKLSGGERGCALSHIRAWRSWLQYAGQDEPLIVFEDDVVPDQNSLETIRSALSAVHAAPPDVLYLGWGHWVEWRRVVQDVKPDAAEPYCIMEADYPCTTHAYIIWPEGARKLLARLPVDSPMDHWMARACQEHAIVSYCIVEGESRVSGMAGDGSPGSEPWGGVVRQHRQDEPDTGACGCHPAEVLLRQQLLRVSPSMFQAMEEQSPVKLSQLRLLSVSNE